MDVRNLIDMAASPDGLWALVVVAVLVVVVVALNGLSGRRRHPLDPQRLFSSEQRAMLFELCNHRCEHKHPLWFRCRQPATHADHVYPHSRGGVTELRNAQGLCRFHNLSKSAKVPSGWYMRSLARRRRRYYPPGAPRDVDWKPTSRLPR